MIIEKSKKLMVLAFFLLAGVVACKKDSDTISLLIGKWNFDQSIEWEYKNQAKIESTKTVYELSAEHGESQSIEFTPSGNFISQVSNGQSWSGTYEIVDNGNAVIVYVTDEAPQRFTIKELTNSNLVLEGIVIYDGKTETFWSENSYTRL